MSTISRRILIAIVVSILLAVLLTLALAFDLSPLLRGGAGWRWPYKIPDQPWRLLPGTLSLVLYLGIGHYWIQRQSFTHEEENSPKERAWGFLLYCVIGGLIVQLAFLAFYGPPLLQLFLRTISVGSGGFFDVGVRFEDVAATLRDYPMLMPEWTAHPRAHPPGIPLVFWGGTQLFALFPPLSDAIAGVFRSWQCHHRVLMSLPDSAISAALPGMLTPLFGLLSVFPLYDLARGIYGKSTARLAALWMPLIPAFVMFTPQWNQFHVLFAVTGLWLVQRALNPVPDRWRLGLIGVMLSVATFFSFTNINVLGLVGLSGLLQIVGVGRKQWSRTEWGQLVQGLILAAVGLASIWLVYYAISGVTPFTLLNIALGIHYELQKPYGPWLFFFLMDLFLFTGWVLVLLAGVEGWRALKALLRGEASSAALFVITLWLAVIILDAAGVARGEVGRLILFLMPLFVVVAANFTAQASKTGNLAPHWLIAGTLAFQLIVMVAFLRVIGTELAPPPTNPTSAAVQQPGFTPEFPASAEFSAFPGDSGSASLIGFDAAASPAEDAMDVTFYWMGIQPFDHAYFVSAIVVGPDGAPLGSSNWLPVNGSYPTSCWASQEIVADHTVIPLDSSPPGSYWVSVSMFDFDSRTQLPVSMPDGSADTQVGLGPVIVK